MGNTGFSVTNDRLSLLQFCRSTNLLKLRFSRRWASQTTLPYFGMTVNFSLSSLTRVKTSRLHCFRKKLTPLDEDKPFIYLAFVQSDLQTIEATVDRGEALKVSRSTQQVLQGLRCRK